MLTGLITGNTLSVLPLFYVDCFDDFHCHCRTCDPVAFILKMMKM